MPESDDPYRGGWCLSSTLLVHELRTYLYGANILELTLTCYVRDLAKPYISRDLATESRGVEYALEF